MHIIIEKQGGRLTLNSREILLEQVAALEDGFHTLKSSPGKQGYTPTRYRFYFGCVLGCILNQAGHLFQITNTKTGERRRMRNTTELHQFFKWRYNLTWIMVGETAMPEAGTTTDLSDREFIGQFQEQIIADHSAAPYLVEFITQEEWARLLKSGQWYGQQEDTRANTVTG